MASSKGGADAVRLAEMERMTVEQLKVVKEQTDLEVNLLQDSLNNIRTATARLEVASSALDDLTLCPQGSVPAHSLSQLLRISDPSAQVVKPSLVIYISELLGKKLLVPLTASLYVPGTLDDAHKVLVDVGTGYFIEKTMTEGKDYCDRKIKLLKSNFDQLIEVASKKKRVADEAGVILQAKLRQLAPIPTPTPTK